MRLFVSLEDAAIDLSNLIDRAMTGEDIVIAPDGEPAVRLVPVDATAARGLGLLNGFVGPEPEGFFGPLTEDELIA